MKEVTRPARPVCRVGCAPKRQPNTQLPPDNTSMSQPYFVLNECFQAPSSHYCSFASFPFLPPLFLSFLPISTSLACLVSVRPFPAAPTFASHIIQDPRFATQSLAALSGDTRLARISQDCCKPTAQVTLFGRTDSNDMSASH